MEENKGKKRIWDKILMGAVIGGAIGSVIGASIYSKKKEETIKVEEEKKKHFKAVRYIAGRLFRKKEKKDVLKIPNEMEK
jgi:hypothetical protein